MYIRRKVFSLLNIEGEERYFSTTEFTLIDSNLEQREFGKKRGNGITDADIDKAVEKRNKKNAAQGKPLVSRTNPNIDPKKLAEMQAEMDAENAVKGMKKGVRAAIETESVNPAPSGTPSVPRQNVGPSAERLAEFKAEGVDLSKKSPAPVPEAANPAPQAPQAPQTSQKPANPQPNPKPATKPSTVVENSAKKGEGFLSRLSRGQKIGGGVVLAGTALGTGAYIHHKNKNRK